ncbi:MarR family winged helix-turn-helix transcriptional regulator [Undibacterium parvum]|uniref:MarR family transcriptional regulator n=1 Tax=Undibacterium parvum TaxID=401471 RepID=A0A3Q9BRE4_9BURK|nr:MarR family transcriptional regulator [Undibacterium parvum]AZP12810.1 MarR family transcriptional regulator [Undibacterium parvum]
MNKRYLRSIRLLAECMQLFEKTSSVRVRAHGFTESQFDIIATLGNTQGMSCKELGEKTLITKGTLTGVLKRLEQKGFLQRSASSEDRRQQLIQLTPLGEQSFADIFPQVVAQGSECFSDYREADFLALEQELLKLKGKLQQHP